ncbi:RHS repeat domain-containing protein [Dyella humi]|uniref:RHS repeat-associated core domain-containing protein n=1 Tax=Dyella humi TaxID=1770547 RepID=A0ABW8IFG4_9GAMM
MIISEKSQSLKRMRALLRWAVFGLLSVTMHAFAQSAGTVTYVYTDPQGTPLAEADANGNITATFDYTPYGTTALGNPPNGSGYTGHVNDPETNLVYMQARYYDPATGRFLSVDPTGPTPGNTFYFNRFAYVGDNPVLRVDPFGKYFCQQSGGCAEFDKAYNEIKQAAAQYSPDSAIGKAFAKVLGYYGEKGEKGSQGNVVNIKEGKTSTGNPAEISHNRFTGSDTITFDVKQIMEEDNGSGAELAASGAHEGQHGVDDATRRANHIHESPDTVNATEHSAYMLQSYVNQGLGVNSVYGLWRSDWPASEVEARRAAAVDKYSELSVQAWQKQH